MKCYYSTLTKKNNTWSELTTETEFLIETNSLLANRNIYKSMVARFNGENLLIVLLNATDMRYYSGSDRQEVKVEDSSQKNSIKHNNKSLYSSGRGASNRSSSSSGSRSNNNILHSTQIAAAGGGAAACASCC
jgi:hypothetical protein